jgi:hypothetical protein
MDKTKEIAVDAWCVSVDEKNKVGCPFQSRNQCNAIRGKECYVHSGQSFPDKCPLKGGPVLVDMANRESVNKSKETKSQGHCEGSHPGCNPCTCGPYHASGFCPLGI